MAKSIVPVVEGYSEIEAVPILIRRISDSLGIYNVGVATPFRVKRNKVVKAGELEKAVEVAIRSRKNVGGILLLLDSDDDCPVTLYEDLKQRISSSTNLPCSVVFAVKEFECWFLGAKESLRGVCDIKQTANTIANCEAIRGAKGRLSANMDSSNYLAVIHQPSLSAQFDFDLAKRNSPSFNKFHKEVCSLLSTLQ